MTIKKAIAWAQKHGRVKNGVVLCENCDNPALKSAVLKMPWIGCGACYFGETDAIDYEDIITIRPKKLKEAQS